MTTQIKIPQNQEKVSFCSICFHQNETSILDWTVKTGLSKEKDFNFLTEMNCLSSILILFRINYPKK